MLHNDLDKKSIIGYVSVWPLKMCHCAAVVYTVRLSFAPIALISKRLLNCEQLCNELNVCGIYTAP